MTIAFFLSMPNCASWNGQWSGAGKNYVIVKTFRGAKGEAKAREILDGGSYYYRWSDGWGAAINVKHVSSSEAAKLRRTSQGFSGYDWMVNSIIQYGKPLADHEISEHLASANA